MAETELTVTTVPNKWSQAVVAAVKARFDPAHVSISRQAGPNGRTVGGVDTGASRRAKYGGVKLTVDRDQQQG